MERNNSFSPHAICYNDVIDPKHSWGENLSVTVPLTTIISQMALAISINHGLFLFLRYLQQPRIVADIITAIVLSPTVLNTLFSGLDQELFPDKSITVLETIANLGLLYAMFLEGLHVELTLIARKTTKTLTLAYAMIVVPFAVGCAANLAFQNKLDSKKKSVVECIFWGTITATTSFPTLAPFLPKLKLLCTDIGREALSMGMINGVFSWFLLFFALALSATPANNELSSFDINAIGWVSIFMFVFLIFCALVIRPIISKIVNNVPEGDTYSDDTIHMILLLVLACGFVMDFVGSHFIFGAVVLGMCIPNGVASILIEKMEDCVLGILMPLYFTVIATRLDLGSFFHEIKNTWGILIAVTCKALCSIVIALFFNMRFSDGMALGVLLSAKGLLPVVIANTAYERGHLNPVAFTGMLMVILLSTIMIAPIMTLGYKRMRNIDHSYQQRTLVRAKPTDELRLMTCIHTPRNVPSIINLLELTNITTKTPVKVFTLHLIEQVGQAPAMLIEHNSTDSSSSWGISVKPLFNRIQTHSEDIIRAFREYEQQNSATDFIQTLTVVSPVESMHEDICSLAENKQTHLIILSFHKQQGIDGKLEDTNIEFRSVNQNVMSASPCSVGLLVDRGLRMLPLSMDNLKSTRPKHKHVRLAMVYIGGPDDREALTYAWRIAGHPSVTLNVVRFITGEKTMNNCQSMDHLHNINGQVENVTILTQYEKEKQIDDEFLHNFQQRIAYDSAIHYTEVFSNNGEETISLLRKMHRHFDMYIIGRGENMISPLISGLAEWSDCPELGPVGDVLITSDFAANTSVLVIQQYRGQLQYHSECMYNHNGILMNSDDQP